LVQLLKLFKMVGVEVFDIVPEWCKPILQFVVQHEGISIIKYFISYSEIFIQYSKMSSGCTSAQIGLKMMFLYIFSPRSDVLSYVTSSKLIKISNHMLKATWLRETILFTINL